MEKQKLIELIEAYRPLYEKEEKYKEDILAFLNENDVYFGKGNTAGHITASSWVLDTTGNKTLLTHHRKLGRWLQLGGHVDEGEIIQEAALREAREESGLENLKLLHKNIFDLDVHLIPATEKNPSHYHYDLRFLILATDPDEVIQISDESNDLKWAAMDEVQELTEERSVIRMVEKTQLIM